MTCIRVRGIESVEANIEKWDKEAGGKVMQRATVFPDLVGKPLGLLIRMEEYEKTAGGTAWKAVIAGACDKGRFTASEILSKAKEATTIDRMLSGLKDKPLAKSAASKPIASNQPTDPFDDSDIPF
jgi:hypothetical protein